MIGRLLRTGIYLGAEFLALYALLVGACFAFMYFGTDFGVTIQFAFGLFALATIPLCAVLVGFGPRFADGFDGGDLATGFYAPVRPLASLGSARRAIDAERGTGGEGTTIRFDGKGKVTALDAVDALAAELDRQGIENTKMGGLTVRDDGIVWRVIPELGDDRLTVSVDSRDRETRSQIVEGVRSFLSQRLEVELVR